MIRYVSSHPGQIWEYGEVILFYGFFTIRIFPAAIYFRFFWQEDFHKFLWVSQV